MTDLSLPGLQVFTVAPRSMDAGRYWADVMRLIGWSEEFGCTGMLLYTGNDVLVEPWLAAQQLLLSTQRLCPLVAVNPIYMHPFTVARMVATFAHLYRRRVWLNLVTGTALSYQTALGDELGHDQRYERLSEYLAAIQALLSQPCANFRGRHYRLENVRLLPRVPPELRPGILLAGQSAAAHQLAAAHGGVGMQMLSARLADGLIPGQRGIHFGMVVRASEGQASADAAALFPDDGIQQEVLALSMENTDSEWKRRLKLAADQSQDARPGYWLGPFRNFKADCPYFVGSYAQAGGVLRALRDRGIDTLVLDVLPLREELAHLALAFAEAR